jgi:hypothetical protein
MPVFAFIPREALHIKITTPLSDFTLIFPIPFKMIKSYQWLYEGG